ncbi:hypothetical protein RMCBS344292_00225 [Rhizopus microsporus]|nr:hypothetical protein RMCBS344292_00225 [Rhizopus microsporus]
MIARAFSADSDDDSSSRVYFNSSRRTSAIPSDIIADSGSSTNGWMLISNRSKYYIPILQWIPHYTRNDFTQDLLSGLSLSALFIPQALSYAIGLCKIPAIHGLYTITVTTMVYACLGTSYQLSVGPEASVSLMVGSGITYHQAMMKQSLEPEAAAAIASLMALFVGLFTFILGILRFGFLDSLMSRSLMRGFITAVAVVVLMQQLIVLLGLGDIAQQSGLMPDSSTLQRAIFLFNHFQEYHPVTTLMSSSVITALIISPCIKRWWRGKRGGKVIRCIPEVLLVTVVTTVLCKVFRLDQTGLDILGTVGRSDAVVHAPLPTPRMPSIPTNVDFNAIIANSIIISIIGFVESIAAAKSFARRHSYFVSSNRELVALGVANIVGSLFQAFPAFGSFPRSKLHESVKPKTQMSSLLSGVICIIVTMLFLPYLYFLPHATLSGIILMAVIALLKELPHDLKFMWRVRAWKDILLMIVTFSATVLFSLEIGTAISVVLSLLATIKQSSCPRITVLGRVKETSYEFKPIHGSREEIEHLKDILIVRIEEPLNFANAVQLKDRITRLEKFGDMAVHPSEQPRRNNLLYIILDLGGMASIDASAVQMLYETIQSYHKQGVQVLLANGCSNAIALLDRAGVLELVGPHLLFDNVKCAIQSIEQNMFYTTFPNSLALEYSLTC